MNHFSEATILDTPVPANIFSATIMRMVNGDEKIILISSKKDVITLKSETVNNEIVTSVEVLNFTNIPSDREIISIHCINRSKEFDDFVIGLTYATIEDNQIPETYLNIYSGSPGSSLEAIIENSESLKLNFVPLQLSHAIYLRGMVKHGMWLISGGDRKIHGFNSDKQQICERKIKEYFVEFDNTKDNIVLSFGTKSFNDYTKRLSFYGCENGYATLIIVDSEKNEILHCFSEYFLSPVTVMQLFNIYNKTIKLEDTLSEVKNDYVLDCDSLNEKEPICFVVASSSECAVVYMDVLRNGLNCGTVLSESNRHQTILTSLITDTNFDSKNEILFGTIGNHILNYAYENNEWVDKQELDIRYPVLTISYLDITGDGVKDLVVMTERGIHIFKHEPKDIIKILKYRLKP